MRAVPMTLGAPASINEGKSSQHFGKENAKP